MQPHHRPSGFTVKVGLLPFLLLATPVLGDQIQGSQFSYGNWQGAAYTDVKTGNFSHCAVSADFLSGNRLIFTVNLGGTVNVAVGTPSDTFIPGEQFDVALYVDRRQPFFGQATGVDTKLATLNISELKRALDTFRYGQTLVMVSKYGKTYFDLTGTSRALLSTVSCALNYVNAKTEVAPTFQDSIDSAVLMQVVTGQVTAVGATDFEFLTDDEMKRIFPNSDPGIQRVFWRSPSNNLLSGILVVNRGSATSLRDTDSSDIAILAAMCNGDFATGARELPNTNAEVREIRAVCDASGQRAEHYLTKFFFGTKVIYTWLWFSGESTKAASQATHAEMSDRAALSTVSYLVP